MARRKEQDGPEATGYPTERLQKGLVLLDDGRDLSEEGVGIGVPVLKRGLQAVFPGCHGRSPPDRKDPRGG